MRNGNSIRQCRLIHVLNVRDGVKRPSTKIGPKCLSVAMWLLSVEVSSA